MVMGRLEGQAVLQSKKTPSGSGTFLSTGYMPRLRTEPQLVGAGCRGRFGIM